MMTPSLPIDDVIPDILDRLQQHSNLVLQAPPGAGKTTKVPLALLDQPWLQGHSILMLEPRRLAARAAAQRMADLLGEKVGDTVGYRVRFEHRVSHHTRIEVLTEGILTRRLQNDPELAQVGLVIFDEYHERSLHADLALALCLESQAALRDDLRLLVMSATLDGAAVAELLDDAPVVTSSGRSYPVEIHYLERDSDLPAAALTARTIVQGVTQQDGDILAFLPGAGEIRRTRELLENEPAIAGLSIAPLYGDLPFAEQQQAILPDPQGRRRIVLATPIAETSLTIEGVNIVVDSGWARVPRFDPRSGLTRLDTVRISADSAEQRAGRAGRLGPGVCYRLWSESAQQRLAPRRTPEIEQADLAPLALELAQWGVRDAGELDWLTAPPPGALAQARELLAGLGALDDQQRITENGRHLLELAMHPRLAHMLYEGKKLGLGSPACDLAALLEERDILRGAQHGSDIGLRLEALHAFRRQGKSGKSAADVDRAGCARADRAAAQWRRRLGIEADQRSIDPHAIGLLLALAYPDRIARRREHSPDRYQLSNGRGARLHENDLLLGQDWLVAAQVEAGSGLATNREGRIFLAAAVSLSDLEQHLNYRIVECQRIEWDNDQLAVTAIRERRLGELVLSVRSLSNPDPQAMIRAMIEGIRRLGPDCLPWTGTLRQWQARVLALRQWLPEESWPDVSDEHLMKTLEDWLGLYLSGVSRRDHLSRLNLGNILSGLLDWSQQRRLDELAPTHLQVPSGSRLRLQYNDGAPPVLAVKLQEMFGLADTPRIAGGRIAVMLHLLSPAQRPVQITQDLKGFWKTTYHEVKKELKGRYPKHPWPDDPWSALPTRRTNLNRR